MLSACLTIFFIFLLINYLYFLSRIFRGLSLVGYSKPRKLPEEFVSIIIPFRNESENILNSQRGWVLIDPSTPDVCNEFQIEGLRGADRDIGSLARTFVAIYLGFVETHVPDDYCAELDDYPVFKRFLDRQLFRSRRQKRLPTAAETRRAANQLLKEIIKTNS